MLRGVVRKLKSQETAVTGEVVPAGTFGTFGPRDILVDEFRREGRNDEADAVRRGEHHLAQLKQLYQK